MEGSNSWGQRSKTGQLSPGCRKTTKTSVKLFNSLKTIKTNLKLSWESIYNIALKPELNWPQQVWQTTFDLYTLKHNAACSAAPRRVITPSERRPLTATSTQLLGGFVKHMGWTNQCRLRNCCGRGLDVATSERSACLSACLAAPPVVRTAVVVYFIKEEQRTTVNTGGSSNQLPGILWTWPPFSKLISSQSQATTG